MVFDEAFSECPHGRLVQDACQQTGSNIGLVKVVVYCSKLVLRALLSVISINYLDEGVSGLIRSPMTKKVVEVYDSEDNYKRIWRGIDELGRAVGDGI